ncbi:MAG: NAD-dependent epimerase/dehydratase family protein [Rhodothermales bacterium]|nr:NAD-dependent epimerase/dehydratase family protein [Rhodothermales bacterium]
MKVLVTGGAGFIASHVADALVAAGHDVHILDDLSSGKMENVPAGSTFHRMDVRDPEARALFSEHQFEILVHHAAQMDVRRSVADPAFDARVNLIGFLNLMESARTNGLKKVIFASTGGAIYGEPEYVPQDENHPLRPLSPYGIAKLSTEKYLYFYEQEYGIPFVALRYGNVYGPRQNPHGEAGVIAIFISRLLSGTQAIIYGDGEQTRDYVFVGDVVRANMAAVDYEGSGIFNVGTSVETDVNQLFRILRDEIRPEMVERHDEARPGEQRRSVLDYRHTREHLSWSPAVSVEDGLKATVEWFRERATNA